MTDQFATPPRFRQELLDELLAHAATLPAGDGPARAQPRVPGRRMLAGIAAAAILAAIVLALRSGGALRPQPATAAEVLRASAAALDHGGGSRALGPGQYFYSRTAVWWRYPPSSPHPFVVRSIQETWLGRSGRGRSRYRVLGVSGSGVPRRLSLARSRDARIRLPRTQAFSLSPAPYMAVSYAQLRRLPTDPARLAAAIESLTARHHVNQQFPQADVRTAIRFEILRMLAQEPTSSALRAALYRVLASTPGIRLLGRTRDSLGRRGMGLAVDVEDARLELIIDPATGELLQTSRTLLRRSRAYFDGRQPPGLINRVTYLASGVVSSTHARAG